MALNQRAEAPSLAERSKDKGKTVVLGFIRGIHLTIMAQRLVRILCRECRQKYLSTEEELSEIGIGSKGAHTKPFYRAVGREYCLGTGDHGRTRIFELLVLDDEVRPLILKNFDSNIIKSSH